MLKIKTTSNGRQPQNIKSCISHQPPISKVAYLTNRRLDLPEILNLSSGDQTKIKNALNEDDL